MWPIRLLVLLCGLFFWNASAFADGVLTGPASEGSGLPPGGNVAECVLNTAPGQGSWQACPGAAGGDSISVDGAAVVDPNFASTGDVDFVNTANTITGNINANSVALGTDTTGNYAAGDAEGGAATSGDSATSFFSTGTIEDARLPSSMADKVITGSLNIPNSVSLPGTCTVGNIYMDTNATSGQRLYLCESTNTWALQGDGGAGGGAPTDATYIMQTANGSTSAEQALSSLSTGCVSVTTTTGVLASRTLTGTSNEITVTNGDCSGTPTFSLPATIDLGGKTSFEVPNAAAPTTDAFGEIAGDNNAWAASRGTLQIFDGTANTWAVNVLASDAPANGECPKWNTGGTITWETCAGGSGDVTAASSFGTDNVLVRSDGTGKGVQSTGISVADTTNIISGSDAITFGSNPGDAGRLRLSNNESICWELATPGTDKCLTLNASDEFEINAPLNLTGTAGATLFTGVASPSAPGTAEQWYFYADSVDDLPKYIYNGGSEQTFYTTANPQTTITGNAGTATALAADPADCSANNYATGIATSGALTCGQVSISAGVSGLGTGVATVLATPSSANFAAAITDETGTGSVVLGTAPTISSAVLSTKVNLPRVTAFPGTPAAGDTVIITDDSTAGACDSAAGSITSLCQYDGAAWVKLGDGTAAGGALSSTDIDTSAEIRAIVGDESGTGALLFAGGDVGAATATTPSANDNDTSVATTAYVQTELTAYASDTVTFTNKTLTSPIISSISNTGTVTLFTATDTVVGKATTDTLTNKTLDCSATGNVCKNKSYIQLTHPDLCDGTNATIGTTATAIGYGRGTYSNSVDAASNYCEYYFEVPNDLDTSVDLRAKVKFALGGADTATHRYVLSSVSVADSAVPTSATLANAINMDFAGDGSGASGDVESVGYTTLTSWAGALTAGQMWRIRLARDGDTSDASTTNSTMLSLTIEYGVTQ